MTKIKKDRWAGHFIRAPHGGNCCGISHVHTFGLPSLPEDLSEGIRLLNNLMEEWVSDHISYEEYDDYDEGIGPRTHCFEATLAGGQIALWETALLADGWAMVHSWHNSNSGNECRLYVKTVEV